MTATTDRVSTTVIDNPAYAWRNLDEKTQERFYSQLDADFVHDNREALDAAATVLFGPILITVWAEHGYQVVFGPDGLPMQRRPRHFPWYQVWDEAAARLDPHAVVVEARLDDELLHYAAAHPRTTELERACTGLRPHMEQLRTTLLDRLDHISVGCLRDEHRIEGWRHLIESATSRHQLDQLDADIPA